MSEHKPLGRVPLERAFSKLGLASRTQARQWIKAGRILVDGKKVNDPLVPVVPERIRLQLDGKPLAQSAWRLIMLNKPRGVVTTRSDEKARRTIFSLLDDHDTYLHPVGRLDMATTGLLFLTNDTRLSDWLTDPSHQIPRVYLVTVKGRVSTEILTRLENGILDNGELLKPQRVTMRKASNRETHLVVELTEGKNREIRRLCEAVGHEVTSLKRVAFGGLRLEGLPAGRWRDVTRQELKRAFPAYVTSAQDRFSSVI